MNRPEVYLDVTEQAGASLFRRGIEGELVMLNLLRFREVADYSGDPELDPGTTISGEEAFRRYIEHTMPALTERGGELVFLGKGGGYLIGPPDERWDLVMLVRQRSLQDFFAFAADTDYLAGLGHRTAALEDSRLLPLVEER